MADEKAKDEKKAAAKKSGAVAVQPIKSGDKLYQPGDDVSDLGADEVARLMAIGVVEKA